MESVVLNTHVYTTTQIVRGEPFTSLAQSMHPDITRLFVFIESKTDATYLARQNGEI